MNEFLQAVIAGDLVAARQAFNSEMMGRIAVKTQDLRREVGASLAPFEDESD